MFGKLRISEKGIYYRPKNCHLHLQSVIYFSHLSSDQNAGPFLINHSSRFAVQVLQHPYIGAGVLALATECAVPFIQPVGGVEKQLPETIVNTEGEVGALVCFEGI